MKNKFLTLLLVCFISTVLSQTSTATYTITFTSNWSETIHPHPNNNFPSNAHWSKLVGATHNENVSFLEMGQLASPGIEAVAELGSNTVFFNEINTAINQGYSNQIIDGDALSTSLGAIIIEGLTTTESFPLLSLVSMIAPSPDWIIAINSISLLDSNGNWLDEIILDLYPYDAGTDSGLDYTSPNMNTDPPTLISSAQGISPFSSEKIGTLTISLENVVLGLTDIKNEESISIFPNPSNEKVTLVNTVFDIKKVQIYNILGRNIISYDQINQSQIDLNIADLNSGVYLFKIIDSKNKTTLKKVVKL